MPAGVVEHEGRCRRADALGGAAAIAEIFGRQRDPRRAAEGSFHRPAGRCDRQRARVLRVDPGDDRMQRNVLVLSAAIGPGDVDRHFFRIDARRGLHRAGQPVVRVGDIAGVGIDQQAARRDVGVRAGSRGRPEDRERAQVLEFLLAESDRFGALARDVGAEPEVGLDAADRQDAERQNEEGDQGLEQRRPALVSHRGRRDRAQKSLQLPLTRANVPVLFRRASTAAS